MKQVRRRIGREMLVLAMAFSVAGLTSVAGAAEGSGNGGHDAKLENGEDVNLSPGETARLGDLHITVESIQAAGMVRYDYEAPDGGQREKGTHDYDQRWKHVLVTVRFKVAEDASMTPFLMMGINTHESPPSMALHDGQGNDHKCAQLIAGGVDLPKSLVTCRFQNLRPGQSKTLVVPFDVAKDANDLVFRFTPGATKIDSLKEMSGHVTWGPVSGDAAESVRLAPSNR